MTEDTPVASSYITYGCVLSNNDLNYYIIFILQNVSDVKLLCLLINSSGSFDNKPQDAFDLSTLSSGQRAALPHSTHVQQQNLGINHL